jgi:hypothetical protein
MMTLLYYLHPSPSMKIPVVHKKQEELISNKKSFFTKEGMDDREIIEKKEVLQNIFQKMKKKELLHYLESKQVSLPSKLQEIEKYEKEEKGTTSKYKPDLVAGSLFKDW